MEKRLNPMTLKKRLALKEDICIGVGWEELKTKYQLTEKQLKFYQEQAENIKKSVAIKKAMETKTLGVPETKELTNPTAPISRQNLLERLAQITDEVRQVGLAIHQRERELNDLVIKLIRGGI